MTKNLESYFEFLLYPDRPGFLPIYLCPVLRSTITSVEMPVIRAYLEGIT